MPERLPASTLTQNSMCWRRRGGATVFSGVLGGRRQRTGEGPGSPNRICLVLIMTPNIVACEPQAHAKREKRPTKARETSHQAPSSQPPRTLDRKLWSSHSKLVLSVAIGSVLSWLPCRKEIANPAHSDGKRASGCLPVALSTGQPRPAYSRRLVSLGCASNMPLAVFHLSGLAAASYFMHTKGFTALSWAQSRCRGLYPRARLPVHRLRTWRATSMGLHWQLRRVNAAASAIDLHWHL